MLECGHHYECEEKLAFCNACQRTLPIFKAKSCNEEPFGFSSGLKIYEEYYVIFSCGHKQTVSRFFSGGWCYYCKKWSPYSYYYYKQMKEISYYDGTKEKKMKKYDDEKKTWRIYDVEKDGLNFEMHYSLESAENSAKDKAAQFGSTFLVYECVSGYKPKSNVEKIKF